MSHSIQNRCFLAGAALTLTTLAISPAMADRGNRMSRVPAKTTAALASTADDGIDGYRTSFYDPFLGMQEKPAESTLSVEHGLEAIEIPSLILLEPQEVPLWRAEDALSDGSRLRVAGLIDSELNTEDFAPWITIPATNQKIGRAIVRGDAYSLRIAISNMQLPEGASLVIYPLDNPSAIVGPFTGAGHRNDGTAYSRTSHAFEEGQQPALVVEVLWPADNAVPADMPFTTEVAWGYYPTLRSSVGGGAGACHNVPACYSAWDDIADSVGHIQYVSGGFSYVCSGQLVATNANDDTPYFLTANHCVNSSSTAASTEFYWRWEKTSCSSSGATFSNTSNNGQLIATNTSSDTSLLMVLGEMPSYCYFSGWIASAASSGSSNTCLHHPSGDYMRISFGQKSNSPNCGGSSSNYFRMSWNDGVTEGGSSGSGVWRDSDQRLHGTLTCGASACSGSNGNGQADSYGRFDRFYSNHSSKMAAGSDDAYEPNDACVDAADLGSGTVSNLVAKSGNDDWYRIEAAAGETVTVQVDFIDGYGDIDAIAYNGCSGSVVDSSNSNSSDEFLGWANTSSSTQQYYLKVYLDNDHRNEYNLIVSGSSTPVCGNGIVEGDEECDDGNSNSGDGCSGCEIEIACNSDCAFPYDGQVDIDDFSVMLVQWGLNGTCDIDDNGTVGLDDFSIFLVDFGPCP
jgi:cysteine-rich repeat protein